jgi:hypothetical protein
MVPVKKIFLSLLLLIVLATQQTYAQQSKTTVYKGDKFTLEYPAEWHTQNENGILNFYPAEDYGALTFSQHSGIDFPLEKTREVILEMHEIKDSPETVKMIKNGETTEFYYEHTVKEVKWVTKVFRRGTDIYILTVNCEVGKWEAKKTAFLKAINSFRLNGNSR